jgi:hypothetical protein
MGLGVGILGFDGNCLVFKEKFSAKLLTCKFKNDVRFLLFL